MKKPINLLMIGLTVLLINSCGKKITFEEQIEKDVYEKISAGYCESDSIAKDSKIKNFQIGEITPIGETGMIDVSLEFDVVNSDGTEKHVKDAMLYLKGGSGKKMLAVFGDYDYRENK
ncbi:MAG: hypothetical protein ABJN84_07170 [Flavobacteriaceae bacterium]